MSEPPFPNLDAELRRLRESSIVHASLRRRPSWFWPVLLVSAICSGVGMGEAFMAFGGNGSILTGLGLVLVGLFGFNCCWPWMWEEL